MFDNLSRQRVRRWRRPEIVRDRRASRGAGGGPQSFDDDAQHRAQPRQSGRRLGMLLTQPKADLGLVDPEDQLCDDAVLRGWAQLVLLPGLAYETLEPGNDLLAA